MTPVVAAVDEGVAAGGVAGLRHLLSSVLGSDIGLMLTAGFARDEPTDDGERYVFTLEGTSD